MWWRGCPPGDAAATGSSVIALGRSSATLTHLGGGDPVRDSTYAVLGDGSPSQLVANRTISDNQDSVAQLLELAVVRARNNDRCTLGGRLSEQAKDLLPGSDVYTLSRFVQQQECRRTLQPFR